MRVKGVHVEKDIILTCVRGSVAYPLSDRQLEELLQERGVSVDHAAINREVRQCSPKHASMTDATPLLLRMLSRV